MTNITRRSMIAGLAVTGIASSSAAVALPRSRRGTTASRGSYTEILRPPNFARGFLGLSHPIAFPHAGEEWNAEGIRLRFSLHRECMQVWVMAPRVSLTHVQLRWNAKISENILVQGDAWERSYGDLHWASLVPQRVMPWYFLLSSGDALDGYGVKTGAGALCFWQIDPDGISLFLNVCNGSRGVELGDRELLAATIVAQRGEAGEDRMLAARDFCRKMCDDPRPAQIIYGSNDWYYAYGQNSAEQDLRDAALMSKLAPAHGPRPFTVIDDGWDDRARFPDMPLLAEKIGDHRVRPGLWIRPLKAAPGTSERLLLPDRRFGKPLVKDRDQGLAYDPTVPEALQVVLTKAAEPVSWGYELIKHDFTTYDLLGQWGFEMQAEPTIGDWSFYDRSKTNAEVIRDLYSALRRTVGERTILIGCNTVGHLGAGIFDAQRTGDDVSGKIWERTRRMGVNTLAYRLPQHRSFFVMDPDCVPITTETPWSCNRQWLDLVARSGVALFVSPEPAATGAEQCKAIQEAFKIAVASGSAGEAIDWQKNTTPDNWEFVGSSESLVRKNYDWYRHSGAWPFPV